MAERRPQRAGVLSGMDPLLALALAVPVAGAARLARWLTGSGAAAAALVGWAVLAGTGWAGGAALLAFFVSGSGVSVATERRQPSWVDVRGNRRDHWQVLANGGAAAVGAAAAALDPALALWVVTASLGAAAADTWATSLGALSSGDPRLVTTGRQVPKGTSGGVSAVGSAGGVAGAAVVALAATLAGGVSPWLPMTLLGLLGMVADSVLGATLQGRFRCARCGMASERPVHRCGARTVLTGGLRWLGNDAVNAVATAAAGASAAVWYWLSSA